MNRDELRQRLSDDVVDGAQALLGCVLVRGGLQARIVEVEAYRGSDDPGAHSFGKTSMKNMVMFGPPGHAYIYFNYGVHWMLNVVAQPQGAGSGILIRAAEPLSGLEEMRVRRRGMRDLDLLSGPGKLAAAFGITGADNGVDLLSGGSHLRIEPGDIVLDIAAGTRVGLAVGKGHETRWRFIDRDRMTWASKPHIR